jgi:hypothetical protein
MKKFSKILESEVKKNYYKATCNVELIIVAETEGDAGKLVDSDLGALEYLSDFSIENIDEISKDEYKEKMLKESYLLRNGKINESIISSWENKFGDKTPSQSQKMEFYHLLRSAGFDKETILETLKERL